MKNGVRPLERAFQLARSGTVKDTTEIREQLDREGYNSAEINGPMLRKQLLDLIHAAKGHSNSHRKP
jgi:hypothetical protein